MSRLVSVTLCVFTYNQASYIEESIKSAIGQDYQGLKIIISDDGSTDGTQEIISNFLEINKVNCSIKVNFNKENLGLIDHVNKVMSMVDTELVVVQAGDDISHSKRVSKIVDAYIKNNKPKLLASIARRIDDSGNILPGYAPKQVILMERLDLIIDSMNDLNCRYDGLYLGATGAWQKTFWEKYGNINYSNCYEDIVMGFRAALEQSFFIIDEPLVDYRVNVGISNNVNIQYGLLDSVRVRKIKRYFDLTRQRLDDYRKNYPTDCAVIEQLEAQINKYKLKLDFYNRPYDLIGTGFFVKFAEIPYLLRSILKYMVKK